MLSIQQKDISLDYKYCNQIITVFHQDMKSKSVSRIVINGVYIEHGQNCSIDRTGIKGANNFLIIIPQSSCKYLPPQEFVGVSGTYTLEIFDKIVQGKNDTKIETAAQWALFIPSQVAGILVIKSIDEKRYNCERCHLEVSG